MDKLSKDEWLVLKWLSREDSNSYGECRGASMDRLLELGIAEFGPIQAGRPEEYRRCWLSDYGWEVLAKAHDASDVGRDVADAATP